MNAAGKRTHLRELLAQGTSVRLAGAHDGLGARLVEEAGFDAVWASGLEISASQALPDESLLGMTEYLMAASQIDRATSLPVIADCDTGFGDIGNVIHMVREYERAGIAGVCIEDKHFPKENSFSGRPQALVSIDHFTAKIRAAKLAQADSAFLVVARTEGFIAGEPVDATITRGEAYERAGADLLVVHTQRSDLADLAAFAARWKGRIPLVAIPTMVPGATVPALRRLGYQVVIFANHGLRAAITAMRAALHQIADEQQAGTVEAVLAPMKEVFALQRVGEWEALRTTAVIGHDAALRASPSDDPPPTTGGAPERRLLFNPGPTNVHDDVRRALLAPDTCHREGEFTALLAALNEDLISVLGGQGTHVSIPFVSSGTGANEAILASIHGTLLVAVAGPYSERIVVIARRLGVPTETVEFAPLDGVDAATVAHVLSGRNDIGHLFVVHHETTTGVIAPLRQLGELCASRGVLLAVDGISSIGGHAFHLERDHVAFCSLNTNKCLESIPGLSFALVRRDVLESLQDRSRSYYFDLHAQWRCLQERGETRFTTATQLVRAARVAVSRLVAEGYDRRVARYARLRRRLLEGLVRLGLSLVPVPEDKASNLHVLVHQPAGLSYAELHDALLVRGIVIYSDRATIERGHLFFATMGAIDESEIDYFLRALGEVLGERVPQERGGKRWARSPV
jgi:2-aminoethylphosphonate aminotransferase